MMRVIASQITGVSFVNLTVCSGADQRKHHRSALLSLCGEVIGDGVNSPQKGPVTRKMFSLMMSSHVNTIALITLYSELILANVILVIPGY